MEGGFHRALHASIPVRPRPADGEAGRETDPSIPRGLPRLFPPALGVRGVLLAARLPRHRFGQPLRVGGNASGCRRRAPRLLRRLDLFARSRAGGDSFGAARSPGCVLPFFPPARIGNGRIFGASGNVGFHPRGGPREGTERTGPVPLARRSQGGIDRAITEACARRGLPALPQPCPPRGTARDRAVAEASGTLHEDAGKPGAPGGDDRPAGGGKDAVPPRRFHLSRRVSHHALPGDPRPVGQVREVNLLKRGYRTRSWAALAAVLLLLSTANPGSVEAGSLRGGGFALDSGDRKSVRLSLKISGAKKSKHRVSFYKSLARQAKLRPSDGRSLSSGR